MKEMLNNLQTVVPPFQGNISFNAQHAPMGAFMSFTCGHFGSGGGIGIEMGKPADQNIFIGVRKGGKDSKQRPKCLPFMRKDSSNSVAANFDVEHGSAPIGDVDCYDADQIYRDFGWASDAWATEDFVFTIYTPFGPIGQPGVDDESMVSQSLLPAIVATLTVDNRRGTEAKTAFFALEFSSPGTRLVHATPERLGFAWKRDRGVLGMLQDHNKRLASGLSAFQRWSLVDGISDVNPVHALGSCGGLSLTAPPGSTRTLVLAIGVHLDQAVTTGLEGYYLYKKYYSSLDQVLHAALDRSDELRQRSAALDAELLSSGLSPDQQFQIAHGTRGYYGSTQLLDVGGKPMFVVNEGEYCMMNTLDLAVDQAFWELDRNPWVVRNILDYFVSHYSYHDEVKSLGGELLAGGISFAHDMGVNNNFSHLGDSSYELPHLKGCFSYMSQEELCNWILTATCYVMKTGDTQWLRQKSHVLHACALSMRNRANPRSGVMTFDSARCVDGQEITTYDSLDESLGQARSNTYLAGKCWACWVGLDALSRMSVASGGPAILRDSENLAEAIAQFLTSCVGADGTLPAVIEKDNPGYQSRILPAVEALIYPDYWLDCLRQRSNTDMETQEILTNSLRAPMARALKQHTICLLKDPQHRNLFPDGGIKLSSTSNNSWISKIAMFEYVARKILRLHEEDPQIASLLLAADAAHVRWQTDGSGYWACSDQFVSGIARGSRYYPRIVVTTLWMNESTNMMARKQSAVAVNVFAKSARVSQTLPK